MIHWIDSNAIEDDNRDENCNGWRRVRKKVWQNGYNYHSEYG